MRRFLLSCVLALAACDTRVPCGETSCDHDQVCVSSCSQDKFQCVDIPAEKRTDCAEFDGAFNRADNPCNFGTYYSAACGAITDCRVECLCF